MDFKIIIPTFNRSAKLQRTLKCYDQLFQGADDINITILDGSEPLHQEYNEKICHDYSFATYKHFPNTGFSERLMMHLNTLEKNEPVCLATDEDVFLPDYIRDSKEFLKKSPDYSMYIGRYITFQSRYFLFIGDPITEMPFLI